MLAGRVEQIGISREKSDWLKQCGELVRDEICCCTCVADYSNSW